VLAALGGLMAGVGLGVALARHGEQRLRRRIVEVDVQLRTVVLPLLERRAIELGLPPEVRSSHSDDALQITIDMSRAISRFTDDRELPFSDTVAAPRDSLSSDATRDARRERRE